MTHLLKTLTTVKPCHIAIAFLTASCLPVQRLAPADEDDLLKRLLHKRLARADPQLLQSIQEHFQQKPLPASQAQGNNAHVSSSSLGQETSYSRRAIKLDRGESSDDSLPGHERMVQGESGNSSEQLQPLPVSAVSLGLAPERSGGKTPTGADIALDALMEEEVAHSAQQFLKRTLPKT